MIMLLVLVACVLLAVGILSQAVMTMHLVAHWEYFYPMHRRSCILLIVLGVATEVTLLWFMAGYHLWFATPNWVENPGWLGICIFADFLVTAWGLVQLSLLMAVLDKSEDDCHTEGVNWGPVLPS